MSLLTTCSTRPQAVWADPRDFNTILVSVLSVKVSLRFAVTTHLVRLLLTPFATLVMPQDHFPDKVSDVLHQVLYDSLQSGTVSYSKALPNVIHDMV